MPKEGNAAASNAGTGGQDPQEVSSHNTPAQPDVSHSKVSVERPESPASKEEPAKDSASEDGDSEESKDDKDGKTPYHKTAAFQRQQRRIRKQNAEIEKRDSQIEKLLESVERLTAAQKGEEYTPPKKEDKAQTVDYQSMFDDELEDLSAKESLSDHDEAIIIELAKKYAIKHDGKEIPLSAEQAYAIYKDRKGEAPEAKGDSDAPKEEGKPSPNTRPSKSQAEVDRVKIHSTHPDGRKRSLDEILRQAKFEARRLEATKRQ